MAYRDLLLAPAGTVPTPEYSVLESERFGLKTSRVYAGPQTTCSATELAAAIRADDGDLVIVRYPADRLDWYATLALETEYRVIYSESLLIEALDLPGPVSPPDSAEHLHFQVLGVDGDRVGAGRDEPVWREVRAIVGDAFAGHRPHYLSNPYLPEVPLADIYTEWLRTMADAPEGTVLLWDHDGEPSGVIGYECFEAPDGVRTGEVQFIANKRDAQRMFQASLAVLEVQRRMEADGVERVVTVVQSHNLGPIVGLLHLGHRPLLMMVTLHLVHPRIVAGAQSVEHP